jgi:acyl-CoA synthetase (AMP-forming)/AMP-acid ligase II
VSDNDDALDMISTTTPSADAAERYRQAGYWLPARPVAQHVDALSSGGERVALIDETSQWTYTQLVTATNGVRALLNQRGVKAGDTVLILAPLRNEAVAAYLGTLHCGAVAILLDRRCGQSDVINACRVAQPRLRLAFDADARRLNLTEHGSVEPLDGIAAQGESALADETVLDPDAPAVVVFTSGTTSTPKGVIHTMNSLRCGAANMVNALGVGANDAFLLASPMAGITGVVQLESAFASRAKVILQEHFSAGAALDCVQRHGATVIGGAPVIAESVFAEADRRRCTELPLRCIAAGGARIPRQILDTAGRFGVEPVRVYGSSEVPFSTATKLGNSEGVTDDGAPLPGVDVAIRDTGGTDELIIRGPHQFHGYLDASDNGGAFTDGWVRTGDQADIRQGRVTIKGRLKDIAIRKGSKISLAEIDTAAECLGECATFALPDHATGERLALAIRTTEDITYEAVIERLTAAGLAKWKLPEQIVFWDTDLPRTASGKIIRQQLVDGSANHRCLYAPRFDAR